MHSSVGPQASLVSGADIASEQSFLAPEPWGDDFLLPYGWRSDRHPRLLGDVNGDGRQDIVAFGDDGVWLSLSNGTRFDSAQFVIEDFGYNEGWRVDQHVRVLADLTGTGRADIVAFGEDGVWTALSTGSGFAARRFVLENFGYNQGWRVDRHVRLLADITGDGRADIVAFGEEGVWIAFGDGAGGFSPPQFVIADLGASRGWDVSRHIRTVADIRGVGRGDIVAFGDAGVWTALSTGSGFAAPTFVLEDFGYNQGWRLVLNPRLLADTNRDGKADIIGVGPDAMWVANSTGDGGFAAPSIASGALGANQLRGSAFLVGDLTGDGYPDIAAWGIVAPAPGIYGPSLWRALGGPAGFSSPDRVLLDFPINQQGDNDVVVAMGDVDGDGRQDLVVMDYTILAGFDRVVGEHTMVARSSPTLLPAPPPAPIDLQITGITPTSLTVSWQSASSDTRYFVLSDSLPPPYEGALVAVTSLVLTGLSPNTEYCVSVRAVSWWGVSEPSQQVCATTMVQPKLADLYVQEVYLDESFPPTGATITITWLECNAGPSQTGPYNVEVRHDQDVIYTVRRTAGLGIGCVSSEQVTTTALEGTHDITVCLDVNNEVTETNKANNCATSEYTGE